MFILLDEVNQGKKTRICCCKTKAYIEHEFQNLHNLAEIIISSTNKHFMYLAQLIRMTHILPVWKISVQKVPPTTINFTWSKL